MFGHKASKRVVKNIFYRTNCLGRIFLKAKEWKKTIES